MDSGTGQTRKNPRLSVARMLSTGSPPGPWRYELECYNVLKGSTFSHQQPT